MRVQVTRVIFTVITSRIPKSRLRVHCLISEDRQVHYTDTGALASARAHARRQCALIFFSPGPVPSEEHFQLSTIGIGGPTPV